MNRSALHSFQNILDEVSILIRQGEFPYWKKEEERNPDDIRIPWKILEVKTETTASRRPVIPFSSEKNAACKLCTGKLSPIKGFIQRGKTPILIVHYTGEYRKGQRHFFKRHGQIFRTTEAENLMDRLLKKVFSMSLEDLYFQEYPGCLFNQDISSESDWKNRIDNCWTHIVDSLESFEIKGVIITGSAAVLKYGKDKALELTGKIQSLSLSNREVPMVVLRSPEGILHLEEKRKKLESKKNSEEYKKARLEENSVKEDIVKYMNEFKTRLNL